jgi:phosphoglycerate dehydrogenase-like enzyme
MFLNCQYGPGAIMDRDAVARALESGQLAGYAGGVWYPQPPAGDHPSREMPDNSMTPHMSGPRCQPKRATPLEPVRSLRLTSPGVPSETSIPSSTGGSCR